MYKRQDLIKAKELKMQTFLVLSGKINNVKGYDTSLIDGIYPSVFEILKDLQCQI